MLFYPLTFHVLNLALHSSSITAQFPTQTIMKKYFALTLAFAIAGFTLTAQQNREIKSHKKETQIHHGQKDAVNELNLSKAQQEQLKANREANKAKMQDLNKQDNLTVKEMRERKAVLMQEQKIQMQNLLTAEQKASIAARQSSLGNKMKNMDNQRGQAMKEDLGLSNDQAARLKALNEATRAKIASIQANELLSMKQKKLQIKAVKDAAKAERQSILTAEQIRKMDERKNDGKGKMKARKDKK